MSIRKVRELLLGRQGIQGSPCMGCSARSVTASCAHGSLLVAESGQQQ
ncbi:hypothetical protein K7B06_13035 [Streptomyces erythrochromogenes]|nr:hypothetical protein [Streptomyces erythrochromogenes]